MQVDLTKDVDSMKKDVLIKYVRELIAFIKIESKKEANADSLAQNLPYEAVSVVGNKLVTLKFDLESKEARVVDIKTDSRDTKTNHMASYNAILKIKELSIKQKEKKNEEN